MNTGETISVHLFAGLEAQTGERRTEAHLALSDAPTVGALCARLGLPAGATGIVLVNGHHARPDRALAAGDQVSLFPPLGGG